MTVHSANSSVPNSEGSRKGILLSKVSKKDRPWDKHRAIADKIARLYGMLPKNQSLAERIKLCCLWLGFVFDPDLSTGEFLLRLRKAFFCRARLCSICQWRRGLRWIARFMQRVNSLDFGNYRWVLLTLTVKNAPIDDLRSTLKEMNQAWKRLIELKCWPAIGFIRSTEITRDENGYVHPHFHVLMLVPASYFGKKYIPQRSWIDLWGEALRVDYSPNVDIRVLKRKIIEDPETGEKRYLAPVEALKYAVKPDDLVGDGTMEDAIWLDKLTEQTRNLRFIATGGVLKNLLKEDEEVNEDLIHISEKKNDDEKVDLIWFNWFKKRYRKMSR